MTASPVRSISRLVPWLYRLDDALELERLGTVTFFIESNKDDAVGAVIRFDEGRRQEARHTHLPAGGFMATRWHTSDLNTLRLHHGLQRGLAREKIVDSILYLQ